MTLCNRLSTLLLLIIIGLLAGLNYQVFQFVNHSLQEDLTKLTATLERLEQQLAGDQVANFSEHTETSKSVESSVEEFDSAAMAENLTEALSKESVDEQWANATEAAFITSIEGSEKFSGSRIIESECRKTFCRVVAEHASQEDLDLLFEEITFIPPWDTHVFIHVEDRQEKLTAIIFVSRQGYSLPEAE